MRRYSQLAQTLVQEVEALKTRPVYSGLPFVDFLYQGGDIYHKVKSHEDNRCDLIAYEYLDDFRLWPLIAWYNNIHDPLTEFPIGTVVVIPIDPISLLKDLKPFTYR